MSEPITLGDLARLLRQYPDSRISLQGVRGGRRFSVRFTSADSEVSISAVDDDIEAAFTEASKSFASTRGEGL